jgi:hypothetical protein
MKTQPAHQTTGVESRSMIQAAGMPNVGRRTPRTDVPSGE